MFLSMKWLLSLAVAAAMVVPAAYLPGARAGQESTAAASAADSAAAGAPLYERYCASCHGANLVPPESVFDLRDLAPSDKQRFATAVVRGKSSMPAWGTLLTPEQIGTLWNFVMSKTSAASAGTSGTPSQVWPCGGDPKLLVDSTGDPVWVASDELLSHAVSTSPAVPVAANAAPGRLIVNVLIDPQGRVKCARAAPGSVDPPPAALEAVGKWTFRPFAAGDQPVAVYGRLLLNPETK
jgi:mono/diheme cytochrome c family protein